MARSFLASALITRAKQASDLENSAFISDAEWLSNLNVAYAWLYDILIGAGERYFQNSSTISLANPTTVYALPSDFYKLVSLDYQISTNKYVTLKPFMEYEKTHVFSGNIPSGTLRVRYIPSPAIFESTDAIDGIAGWEELVVIEMAIMAGIKEESDTAPLERRRAYYLKRIEDMSKNRDMQFPGRVQDVAMHENVLFYPDYANLRYQIQGNSVELLQFGWTGI